MCNSHYISIRWQDTKKLIMTHILKYDQEKVLVFSITCFLED